MKTLLVWGKIVIPPLLMVPLAFMPMDFGTGFLWFIAFCVFLKSSIGLARALYRRLAEKERFKKEQLRPLLAVVILVLAVVLVTASLRSADNFARRLAAAVQAQCRQEGRCPDRVDGHGLDFSRPGFGRCEYGDYGARYTVAYVLSEDKRGFEVRVRHNIDEFFIVKGGVEKKLVETGVMN